MSTIIAADVNEGALYFNADVSLSAAAAVGAVRGTGAVCTKTGTGAYLFTWKGLSRGLWLVEVLSRSCDLSGAPATAFWAKITAGPAQTSGGTSDGDITCTVTTLSNAATPVATDTTAACQLSVMFCVRTVKDPAIAAI